MCGIAGEIRFDGQGPDRNALARASSRLQARGPDSQGAAFGSDWGFVHRRLSIIDLSPAGNQPMALPETGLSIVYNGEIYNYKDLREDLIAKGHHFRSHSDTETLLRGYQEWGAGVLDRINGMFAFCIRDEKNRRHFLARDRLGIKPLYYAESPQAFIFASNMGALLSFEAIDRDLDPIALHHYLSLHAIVPAPRTILKGVKKLEAGHWLEISFEGKKRLQSYWQADYADKRDLSEEAWEDAITAALRAAVKRRLVADVPVGLFLSGGVDSSLITALMIEAGSKDLLTFSVGFKGASKEEGDEFQYSDLIADKFRTRHHRFRVATETLLEHLPDCIRQMNEPMVSYDNIGFYLLSKAAAEHVKVVQSGQGADEVFGGYHWYPPMMASKNPVDDYARLFFDRTAARMKETLTEAWYGEDHTRRFVEDYFARDPRLSPIDQALKIDTHVMLVEDPVKRVDSNTMAFGLEARVPFLDHEVVETAARMPAELKIKDGGKYLLKKIARKFIPAEVIDRPKGYFPVPQLKYIQGPFLDFVRRYLRPEAVEKRGIYRKDYVKQLMDDPQAHITPLRGSALWQIAVLEIWLREQGIKP